MRLLAQGHMFHRHNPIHTDSAQFVHSSTPKSGNSRCAVVKPNKPLSFLLTPNGRCGAAIWQYIQDANKVLADSTSGFPARQDTAQRAGRSSPYPLTLFKSNSSTTESQYGGNSYDVVTSNMQPKDPSQVGVEDKETKRTREDISYQNLSRGRTYIRIDVSAETPYCSPMDWPLSELWAHLRK
ncbi:hypothetical protein SODALDRAFT_377060 [Sodiomyces alkalinus F11]|uniref:Uncharacterized protein n=1 Tax=Sodiomyces alkalinus (strain CBS 110278 / VKM F-3762 / F11) TaxID=1314773 RepID=A0A3N2Q3Q8_SODAK|nr:hypothetical protein SODALDRAFT_377060 [Sodiomyces alkalinus F11]ROT41382.1 hypothetical protein SODALDRAFT_377060 [Sodiomyces alkalinus F11]